MRKFISKMMTLIMAMTMVLATSVTVFAADADKKATLTINGQEGAEYTVYQVMSADEISNGLYAYTVSPDFQNGVFPLNVGDKKFVLNGNNEICLETTNDNHETVQTPITTDGLQYDKNTYKLNSDTAQLAAALADHAKTEVAKLSIAENAKSASKELSIGYYLIKQTKVPSSTDAKNGYVASKPVLVNLTENKVVTAKDDTEKLDKTITGLNTDTSKNVDENTAKIGDVINYKVTTYIPTYGTGVDRDSLKFYLYDTFSKGITYNNDVKVFISDTQDAKGNELTTGFTTDKLAKADATFEINLNSETILANQGKYVTLEYSGTLNKDAVINSVTGNPNTIELKYTNNPGTEADHLKDTVKTYSFGLGIKKVDKATQEELDGAVFTLTKSGTDQPIQLVKVNDDEYRVATKDEIDNGNTVTDILVNSKSGHNPVIKGLDEGKYVLHEKTAPDHYSVVSDITVTVKANMDAEGMYTGAATISVDSGKLQDGKDEASKDNKVTATDGTVNINVYVEDTKGISLPETGSKTAMYCLLGGGLLVIMGGAFFGLTSRKKRS